MKLVTFRSNKADHVGAIVEDRIVDLTQAGIADTMIDLVRAEESGLERARAARDARQASSQSLATATLRPPIRPGKLLCCGINYKSHADENPNAKMPAEPFFFAKLPTSVVGPETPVVKPVRTEQMDYEVEFSAVIGKPLHKADDCRSIRQRRGLSPRRADSRRKANLRSQNVL